VVVSYVKDGTLEFCCVVYVENVRWNVGVVTEPWDFGVVN
jgi:hypothetical protein